MSNSPIPTLFNFTAAAYAAEQTHTQATHFATGIASKFAYTAADQRASKHAHIAADKVARDHVEKLTRQTEQPSLFAHIQEQRYQQPQPQPQPQSQMLQIQSGIYSDPNLCAAEYRRIYEYVHAEAYMQVFPELYQKAFEASFVDAYKFAEPQLYQQAYMLASIRMPPRW